MIRIVPTGDIGFDVVLGGGWCLVERLPGKESATVLLRGGPGTGKTLLSVDIALALAGALGGDVLVGCVELLPSEFVAQIQTGRGELALQYRDGPPLDEPRVVRMPVSGPVDTSVLPRIFCGLLPELSEDAPDLVAAFESLRREVVALGGSPVVLVVDSLIGGYGLGQATPRKNVDALMKFATQEGVGLVICAETIDDAPAAWDFAVDTVIMLRQAAGKRSLQVQKHRFGASTTGSHEFRIGGWLQPAIYPRPDTWSGIRRIHSTLRTYGWRFVNGGRQPSLSWDEDLAKGVGATKSYQTSFAVVTTTNVEWARRLAFGLFADWPLGGKDLLILLDSRSSLPDGYTSNLRDVHIIPISMGAAAAICDLTEYLGRSLFPDGDGTAPRRIILGDLALTSASTDAEQWGECLIAIANLVASTGCSVPVIAYDSGSLALRHDSLRYRADLIVDYNSTTKLACITNRAESTVDWVNWPAKVFARADYFHPEFVPPSRHLF